MSKKETPAEKKAAVKRTCYVSGGRIRMDEMQMLTIVDEERGLVWAYVPYCDTTLADHLDSYADARNIAKVLTSEGTP